MMVLTFRFVDPKCRQTLIQCCFYLRIRCLTWTWWRCGAYLNGTIRITCAMHSKRHVDNVSGFLHGDLLILTLKSFYLTLFKELCLWEMESSWLLSTLQCYSYLLKQWILLEISHLTHCFNRHKPPDSFQHSLLRFT